MGHKPYTYYEENHHTPVLLRESSEIMSYLWGVDSSTNVTQDLYNCVLNNYGKPEYWGRYLTTVPNAAEGLTQEEIGLLHNSGTKVPTIHPV
ncbi:hypothetical protein [Salinibacillus kushneri]|uniref:hypothetical protein n=1 Tax=Salinibacillus kushneri TaxID=237682 RepID=UPI0015A5135D